jgi:hypothetical protein
MNERRQYEKSYLVMVRDVDDGPVSRVKFHVKMLDVYFSRLLGFCRLEIISSHSLLENTLFLVADVASSIAAKDVGKLNPLHDEIRLAWSRYAESLASLKDGPPDMMKVEHTFERLKEFGRTCDEAFGKCS